MFLLGLILCNLGLHRFGKVIEDYVRGTGEYLRYEEFVYQKGLKKCKRSGCGFEKKVWRSGWTGPGMKLGFWKKLRPSREARIDALRYRQLMG